MFRQISVVGYFDRAAHTPSLPRRPRTVSKASSSPLPEPRDLALAGIGVQRL